MRNKDETLLAAFGQLNRNDEFKIITKIVNNGPRIFVRKEAYTEKAIPHIERLKKNHESLGEKVSSLSNIRVANILDSGNDFVEFEYIKGRSVEYETFKFILSGNYDKAIDVIDRIFALIDRLSAKRHSHESKAVQKINDIYHLPASSTRYTSPGVIDINLDNFILSPSGDLVAFDCEWIFDKPIVTDFIKTRLLHTFFARRSEAFAFLPSDKNRFKSIQESGNQTLIPNQMFDKYSELLAKQAMRKYWKAEDIFQSSVNKFHTNSAVSNLKSLAIVDINTPRPTFPETEESLLGRYHSLTMDFTTLQSHLQSLENELALIKSSKTFKVAKKMASAKNKLLKR